MWKEGIRIYGTPGVPNNFPNIDMLGEIIEFSGGPRHLSTILLKNFNLFKIAESVINFCLKIFSN